MKTFRLALALSAMLAAGPALAEPSHAIAMHGEPALPAGYAHFPYVNPDAPKGGRIDYAVQGTFDSLNPFIVQGSGARGILDLQFGYNVFESLMARSYDEAFTLYPLLAESVETDEERTFVEFTLDARARFSDGEPVTPEDVIFTVELLRDKGFPRYGVTARKIERMEKVGERGIRFTFGQGDRELPLILGLMPVLPKHATDAERFDRTTLEPMIGSGPYRIASVRAGEQVTLARDPDYWAKDHPSKVGFDNFDTIRINYYRDANTMFEAFKKGLVDVQIESSATRWQTGYDFPAVASGEVVKEAFRGGMPSGMQGFVLNSRRPVFAGRATRRALAGLFDFEWANQNLFSGAYARTKSFYDNSELSSAGIPADASEMAMLGDHAASVDPAILAGEWRPPVSDGSGRDRAFLRQGFEALQAAGYRLDGGRMLDANGRQLGFELMLRGRNGEEIAMAWQRTLERLGVRLDIRSVDDAQYQQRLLTYDFDSILQFYPSSLSPGVEQIGRWGSSSRDVDGTLNFAGVADPAVDAMIGKLLNAREREEFVAAVRAYDRVLLSGFHVVPLYHQPEQWVARWRHVRHPEITPVYGFQLVSWWRDDG